ncbi:MAG: Spo0B domain-containing protein [Clostridia bacterium]|nr:Spo0B domain-containing protein [Clostridia bacterium]
MNKKLNINKTMIAVVSLSIIQVAVMSGILIYDILTKENLPLFRRFEPFDFLFLGIIIVMFINSFISLRDRRIFIQTDQQYEVLKETLERVEKLNHTLKAQRHDFLNHLQVVYGLMEMEEYKDAREYIDKVYSDIQKVGKVLKTSNPAVNALLQAKMLSAEKRNITLSLRVASSLKELKIPSWEVCRVLGNIVDNAMDALMDAKEEKWIRIEISEDLKYYRFLVGDNGSPVNKEIIEKIFEPGFTTKGENGQGMGLAICKEILSCYNGGITVRSDEQETVFEVFVPK